MFRTLPSAASHVFWKALDARLIQRNQKISPAMIAFDVGEQDHAPRPPNDGLFFAMRAGHHMPIEGKFDNVDFRHALTPVRTEVGEKNPTVLETLAPTFTSH